MTSESAPGVMVNDSGGCRNFSSQDFHAFRDVNIGRGATCEVYVGQLITPSSIGAAQVAPVVLSDAAAVSFSPSNSNQLESSSILTPMQTSSHSANSTLSSPLVALKYVSKRQSTNTDDPFASPCKDVNTAIKRLAHEQQILSQLDHPGVCKLFGKFSDDTCAISVQRLYPYGSLASHLRAHARRLMPMSIVREYMQEMVLILHYMHSEPRVAHRDISAKNFVLDKQGHLVLIDFGMAHVESSIICSTVSTSSSCPLVVVTTTAAQLAPPSVLLEKQDGEGSLYYLAPERLGFECSSAATSASASASSAPSASTSSSDFASDWWALGVIFHEMLFGFLPFDGNNENEIRAAIRQYSESACNRDLTDKSSSGSTNNIPANSSPQCLLPHSTLERLDCGGPIAARGTDSNISLLSQLLHPNPTHRWGAAQFGKISSHPFFSELTTQWPQTQQQAVTHWASEAAQPCATNLGAFASLECAKDFESADSKSLEFA